MKLLISTEDQSFPAALRAWWAGHGRQVLYAMIVIMSVLAIIKLSGEFHRLIWEQNRLGAIDLKHRYREVHLWFAGQSPYDRPVIGTYPPASYTILWPLVGWLSLPAARRLFAVTVLIALAGLAILFTRAGDPKSRREKLLIILMPLSLNASGVTIGNGQLGLHILPLIIIGSLWACRRGRPEWWKDALAAGLFTAALVKPNITAPFFWIILFSPGRIRPAVLVLLSYSALTFFSLSFQAAGLAEALGDWLVHSSKVTLARGYADVDILLSALGLAKYNYFASLLILLILGGWIYRHRRADIWVLLGVTALAARFWTYHGMYDDVLLLLPMVALYRLARAGPAKGAGDIISTVLLGALILAMLAPSRMFNFWAQPWPAVFTLSHSLVWFSVLIWLLVRAESLRAGRA